MIEEELTPRRPSWADRLDSLRNGVGRYQRDRSHHERRIVLGVRRDLDRSVRSLWGLRRPLCALTQREQAFHALIWGTTGSGKSKLLQSLFQQHIDSGHGVGLLEPHNDLSIDILSFLLGHGFFRDPRAFQRLVYLDFAADPFVPFNILARSSEPQTAAMQALDGMTRTFPELSDAAPMFKTVFVAAAHVLLENHRPITDMFQLLTDASYRRRLLDVVDDPLVLHVFRPLEHLAPRAVEAIVGSSLRRIFQLCYPLASRRSLGAQENVLDFRRLMDDGSALLINLGNVGDAVSKRLLGAMIMVQLEHAALSRTDIDPADRRPMTFLVDEWSSFAAQADTLKNVLDQTRKFGLRLYLSGQSLSQLDSDRLAGAVENCGLSITLNLGRSSAELQVPQIMHYDPHILLAPPPGPSAPALYASVDVQRELWTSLVQDMPQRRALVKRRSTELQAIDTLFVRQQTICPLELEAVLEEYHQRAIPLSIDERPFDRMNQVSEETEQYEYERSLDDPHYWDTEPNA